jgi:hypothetical protein
MRTLITQTPLRIAGCWSVMARAKMQLLVTLLVVTVWQAEAQSNAPVRLALITESGEASTVVDVLTVQLSKNDQIQLLERNEIEKVYREQGLSAANKDYLKLGQILGADGLLLFDVVRMKQATNLTARLIAVKPGVVLLNEAFPWPLKDLTEWTPVFANHLRPLLPKLSVLPKDAIPLSVINFRSAVQSVESQETERQLKLLAIQRLSQVQQFFVLERQKMQRLSEEKVLKVDESVFWNGSYLLEGVVDQNGYSKETLTINARLTPPKGGTPLLIEAGGSRTNYAEVINRLAAKVAELLKVNSTVKEWNAADEAQQYFDEAKWALRWEVAGEAQAASDSAWALGKQDLDCAMVRVRAYLAGAPPARTEDHYEIGYFKDNERDPTRNEAATFVRGMTNEHPGKVIFACRGHFAVSYAILNKNPDYAGFDQLVHAMELYRARAKSPGAMDAASRKEWCNLGIKLLETAGQWLRNYYLAESARVGHAEQLAVARKLASEIAGGLHEMPESDTRSYWNVMGAVGVFWCETPEQGVAIYRDLFHAGQFAPVRSHAMGCYPDLPRQFCSQILFPMLADWHGKNHDLADQIWLNLVEEMCASTNNELRGNGYFFVCVETYNAEKFKTAFLEMHRCLDREEVFGESENLFIVKAEQDSSQDWMKLRGELWGPVIEDYAMTGHVPGKPSKQTEPHPPGANVSPPAMKPTGVPPTTNPTLVSTRPTAHQESPAVVTSAANPTPQTNRVEVTRYWEPPLPKTVQIESTYSVGTVGAPSSVISFCYREGYLWAEVEHEWGHIHPRYFFRVNLKTFESEAIAVDTNRYHPQEVDVFTGLSRTFEVDSNHLYISSSDGIKKYSLASKKWEDLPVPVDGYARIIAFNGRIFLSSATAIVEMTADGSTSRALASTRRVPPMTVLDKMDNYFVNALPNGSYFKSFAPLFPGPDGSVIAFVKGAFYLMPRQATNWIPLAAIPDGREASRSFSPAGLLVFSVPEPKQGFIYDSRYRPAREAFLMSAGSTNAELVFEADPQFWGPRRDNVYANPGPARWAAPEGMEVADLNVSLDGDTVWVLCGEPGDEPVALLHYLPNQINPVRYALHFKRPDDVIDGFRWRHGKRSVQVEATPEGILIGCGGSKGFPFGGVHSIWFIPAADLQVSSADKGRPRNP